MAPSPAANWSRTTTGGKQGSSRAVGTSKSPVKSKGKTTAKKIGVPKKNSKKDKDPEAEYVPTPSQKESSQVVTRRRPQTPERPKAKEYDPFQDMIDSDDPTTPPDRRPGLARRMVDSYESEKLAKEGGAKYKGKARGPNAVTKKRLDPARQERVNPVSTAPRRNDDDPAPDPWDMPDSPASQPKYAVPRARVADRGTSSSARRRLSGRAGRAGKPSRAKASFYDTDSPRRGETPRRSAPASNVGQVTVISSGSESSPAIRVQTETSSSRRLHTWNQSSGKNKKDGHLRGRLEEETPAAATTVKRRLRHHDTDDSEANSDSHAPAAAAVRGTGASQMDLDRLSPPLRATAFHLSNKAVGQKRRPSETSPGPARQLKKGRHEMPWNSATQTLADDPFQDYLEEMRAIPSTPARAVRASGFALVSHDASDQGLGANTEPHDKQRGGKSIVKDATHPFLRHAHGQRAQQEQPTEEQQPAPVTVTDASEATKRSVVRSRAGVAESPVDIHKEMEEEVMEMKRMHHQYFADMLDQPPRKDTFVPPAETNAVSGQTDIDQIGAGIGESDLGEYAPIGRVVSLIIKDEMQSLRSKENAVIDIASEFEKGIVEIMTSKSHAHGTQRTKHFEMCEGHRQTMLQERKNALAILHSLPEKLVWDYRNDLKQKQQKEAAWMEKLRELGDE